MKFQWKFMKFQWSLMTSHDVSIDFTDFHWGAMDFQWKFMKFQWSLMTSHDISTDFTGLTLNCHRIPMKTYVIPWRCSGISQFSLNFYGISMKFQWKLKKFREISIERPGCPPGGPRGHPGAEGVFYLSLARTLYCLGLSSLLSCWPGGDSH